MSDGTRARILQATFEQVADVGLSGLALEDVAGRAGVSRQTVYRHFGSREGLVEALLVREEEWFIDRVVTAAAAHADATDAITAGVTEALHAAQEHALLRRLIETEPGAIVPLIVLGRGPVLSAVRPVVARILEERLALSRETAAQKADVGSRLLVSYVLDPGGASADEIGRRIAAALVEARADGSEPNGQHLPA